MVVFHWDVTFVCTSGVQYNNLNQSNMDFHLLKQLLFQCIRNIFFLLRNRLSFNSPCWPTSHYIGQTVLELVEILLLQPPKCWDYRCEASHLACQRSLNLKKKQTSNLNYRWLWTRVILQRHWALRRIPPV